MIYFAIFPVHPINPQANTNDILKEEIAHFKEYLDSKGSQFGSLTEFLPFFALPYIANPRVTSCL